MLSLITRFVGVVVVLGLAAAGAEKIANDLANWRLAYENKNRSVPIA